MKNLIFFLLLLALSIFSAKANAQTLICNCDNVSMVEVNAPSGLVLRAKPTVHSKKLGLIPDGERILAAYDYDWSVSDKIEGTEGHWVRAHYNGKDGFVFNGYLGQVPDYSVFYGYEFGMPEHTGGPLLGVFTEKGTKGNFQEITLKNLSYETVNWEANGEAYYYPELVVENESYPDFIVTGLSDQERKTDAHTFDFEQGILYPGTMKTMYFDSSHYTLYATGIVVKSDGSMDENWQTMTIKDYQVILEKRTENNVERQVVFSKEDIPVSHWGSTGLTNIRLAGDLDQDGKPDFILENYYEYSYETMLFLSSEADPQYLVKGVFAQRSSGC